MSDQELFHELSFYTLSHASANFIHQHAVDVFTAQKANQETKLIAIYYALVGLYLYIEKGYTGKQVQNMHLKLSQGSKTFEPFDLPVEKGDITIVDVIQVEPGLKRDAMIKSWCEDVWSAYKHERPRVAALLGSV